MQASYEQPSGDLERFLQSISRVGAGSDSGRFVVQVALASRSRIFGVLAYVIALFGWWALAAGLERAYTGMLVVSLVGRHGRPLLRSDAADVNDRRFRASMAGALGVTIAGAAGGPESAWIVLGGLVPARLALLIITRFNVLGAFHQQADRIRRRVGKRLPPPTLLVARRASDWAQQTFEAFAPVIEVMLILAAVSVWIPLYAWMNRVLSKRTQVYADFGKRLIQETAAISDF